MSSLVSRALSCAKCVLVVAWVAVTTAAPADSTTVSLLRPDSLAGWEYGVQPCRGWTIAAGRLTGQAPAVELLSGWSWGEFTLTWEWTAAAGSAWHLALPDVPQGTGLRVAFRDGAGCGRLTDDGKELAAGRTLASASQGPHKATLQRRGDKLTLGVDERPLFDVTLAAGRRFGLGLGVDSGSVTINNLKLAEPVCESLFNGKDLSGYWCPGDIKCWAAQDGKIVWVKPGGSYLRTEHLYGNFTFTCEYKSALGTNSGIGIRTSRLGWPSGDGMELQLWDKPWDTPIDKHQTMAIYGNVPPYARADRSLQWNRVVIKADGYMISAWINGELVQQVNTFNQPELKHRNLKGWIGFQDHNGGIEFRDIRVLEAPDGLGLAQWYRPQPARATAAVVDRLMNSERLSLPESFQTQVVAMRLGDPQKDPPKKAEEPAKKKAAAKKDEPAKKDAKDDSKTASKKEAPAPAKREETSKPAPSPPVAAGGATAEKQPPAKPAVAASAPAPVVKDAKPQLPPVQRKKSDWTLAELTGPGAIVRVARTGSEGELAFFFDGEAQPRLVCKPADLWKTAPELSEDDNPTLTCITYKKSLKVVLRNASGAEYRFDYVTFPKEMQLESFTGPEGGFPRGWLSALHYRHSQHSGGTVRENELAPRYQADKAKLEPGQSRTAVTIAGAGVVQWFKLQVGKQALDNNDLWLEVTPDGQPAPAIAAPVRYWLPAFAGGGNHHNFVFLERNGLGFRLAMPFAKGITFTLRNKGATAINDVGLIVSVLPPERAEQPQMGQRMRLQGRFMPAGETTTELAHLDGHGRLVGFVYQQPGVPTPVAKPAEKSTKGDKKTDAKKADAKKAEDKKAAEKKAPDQKADQKPAVALKPAEQKANAPKPEGPKADGKQPAAKKADEKKSDAKQADQKQPEPKTTDEKKPEPKKTAVKPAAPPTPPVKWTGIAALLIDGQAQPGWQAPDLEALLGYVDGDFRRVLCGRRGGLVWRYFIPDSRDFRQSLVLKANDAKLGDRFVLWYAEEK